jgi:formiminoglutamase
VHSGSPFRLLLEDGQFVESSSRFVEFAAQGSQCGMSHARFVTETHHQTIYWLSTLRKNIEMSVTDHFVNLIRELPGDLFVSFDLDSVRGSDAPGVSCASPSGLIAQEAMELAFEAGKCPRVRVFDLSEYNPLIEDYRTGRLVAMMFYYFCMGLVHRLTSHVPANSVHDTLYI